MKDEPLESALASRDPRKVAALLRNRSGYVTFYRRGDQKRAQTYARQKQNEVFRSKEPGELMSKMDNLVDSFRSETAEDKRGGLADKINKLRNLWQKQFGKYDEFYSYYAKTLEIKSFLKQNRQYFR